MPYLKDYEAQSVKLFLEDKWDDFVESLSENYEDEAEQIAEEICNKLA